MAYLAPNSIIAINPGHTIRGKGTGAVGIVKETDINRIVGKLVMTKLKNLGYKVIDCTIDSSADDLKESSNKANANKANLFVSIHLDSHSNLNANGSTSYCYALGGQAEQYAKQIQKELVSLGHYDRGVRTANYYVLKNTNMPAVLIELFYCMNRKDVDLYNKNKAEAYANAIVKGITGKQTLNDTSSTENQKPNTPNTPNNNTSDNNLIATDVYYVNSLPYKTNAVIKGDFFYVRDKNGNKVSGRQVDDGDRIIVLEVWKSKNLVEVIYPSGTRYIHGYIKNVPSLIVYDNESKWHNGSTKENVYTDSKCTQYMSSIKPYEKATPLYRKDNVLHVVYSLDNKNDISGYVKFNGMQQEDFYK